MSNGRRVIAHLDCDAFYVSVELLRRPDLRGLPVVVAGSGPRAVVTTASYEARRFGVGSASPASRARRLCPDAIFLPPDFPSYRAKSSEVWGLARERLPLLQVVGLDEGYADVTALERPLSALRTLVADIEAATGIVVSVGVGPNRLVAKVSSDLDKPRGFVVLSREQACERLAGASPKLIPGIGPKTVERLRALGIETIGQLQAAPEDELARRFGDRQGRYLLARAHFHDTSPVSAESGPAKSRSSETTFDADVVDPAELEAALARLCARLADSLERRAARGRTVAIKVRLDDWTTVTRARTLPEPVPDAETLTRVAVELLRAYAPARPVRLLGVRMAAFEDPDAGGREAPSDAAQLALPV
ncbi:MAG: DNA polymerase IV [uncultured Solirubrobacteraceae bacterium]|uniref:DNA polymerase IV n=1 Tax=uncultured Solirubrobacteraceae bacterium TaxID=1162706 RepID=A0A6J4RXT3_9ACTN|nr:MAG: DNA polymerase IV [uncultured Solirubrobacteraceae bacterium]